MVNEHIGALARLVAPPDQSSLVPKDWANVTSELGIALPPDYIALMDAYGGGRFDEYLWTLEPGCGNEFYDLGYSIEERSEAYEMLWAEGEAKPAELADPDGVLIPWASTDNGEFVFWLANPGVPPEKWTTMVNEARGEEWEHFEVGCVEFLVSVLSGAIRSEILSSDFPLPVHEFRSVRTF